MRPAGTHRLAERLRGTPALHLADQVLSSGTNFLAVVIVARSATPEEFGLFSLFLVTFFVATGFNRAVPHAVAMTMEWDDERARSGYFFLPPMAIGVVASAALVLTFALLDGAWVPVALLLLPLLLQDAVRMHAFAVQRPELALLSDAVWLVVMVGGFVLSSSAVGAAAAWGAGAVVGLLVTRPWRIRLRFQRRPVGPSVVSAALEFATLSGIGYLTPLLASPIIGVVGVAALQGANVIRGPLILLIQGLMVHRMAGPPVLPGTSIREAARLSGATLAVTLACVPPLYLLRDAYGPRLLGATWPEVEPLVVPALLGMVLGSVAFGPATVVRKMGRFGLSAKVQGALSPAFVVLPLIGAAAGGPPGFLYATAGVYGLFALTWWIVLPQLEGRPADRAGLPAS